MESFYLNRLSAGDREILIEKLHLHQTQESKTRQDQQVLTEPINLMKTI